MTNSKIDMASIVSIPVFDSGESDLRIYLICCVYLLMVLEIKAMEALYTFLRMMKPGRMG